MKILDFYKVTIQIMGIIILLFDPYGIIVNLFSEVFRPDRETYIIVFLIVALCAVLLLAYYCIFKAQKIISLLQLDKESSKEISLNNVTQNSLLTLAIFIIGGILIVYSFSSVFVSLIYSVVANYNENIALQISNQTGYNLVLNIIDLLLGIILVFNSKRISNLFQRKI